MYAAFGQPLEETITDADGRFKMTVERSTNSMYVVVCTERQIGDKEEKYLWIESVGDYGYIPVGQQSVDVILSNQNKQSGGLLENLTGFFRRYGLKVFFDSVDPHSAP